MGSTLTILTSYTLPLLKIIYKKLVIAFRDVSVLLVLRALSRLQFTAGLFYCIELY